LTTHRVGGEAALDPPDGPAGRPRGSAGGILSRQLAHYPDSGPRTMYLGITVLATIVLYYELYIQGAVATKIIVDFGMSFTYFVVISIVGNAVGAFASLLAGLADRWGRANLVVGGLLITGLLILFGLPNASSKGMYLFLFAIVSVVEGVVLVATPALIRDFSPQVGRGAAMGFWTLGPVLGSLVVTLVSSHTLTKHPDWQFQFRVCGIAGLVVFVIAFIGLRELSPRLRDQLMVSMRDRALIEARASGLDPEKALEGHWRQMLKFDVVGPAFAISVFLLIYYIAVGFFIVYYATVFGYSPQKANGLANWYWATNAIALVVAGVLSDKVRVRKPFMLFGAAVSLIGTALFAMAATKPDTSYYTFAFYFILIASGSGIAYCNWMAAYTETVERHNPAATATGLAIWGWILRAVVTGALALLVVVVPATGKLVDASPRADAIKAAHPAEFQVLAALDYKTVGALGKNPNDPAALPTALGEVATQQKDLSGSGARVPDPSVEAAAARRLPQLQTASAIDPALLTRLAAAPTGPDIAAASGQISQKLGISSAEATARLTELAKPDVKADLNTVNPAATALTNANEVVGAKDVAFLGTLAKPQQKNNPQQWQTYWWITFAGQLVFIPFVFLLTGRWSPKRAKEDELEHEQLVQNELARLSGQTVGAGGTPPGAAGAARV
jgi:ACS family D-galactonate transporter-like MFS transporter